MGKKTAERLVVEMKDRFKGLNGDLFRDAEMSLPASQQAGNSQADAESEAIEALISSAINRRKPAA